jgi:hypothetical protein
MNALKKNNKDDIVDDYMSIITKKCTSQIKEVKNLIKIKEDSISIPTLKNYDDMLKYNYNITQLKIIAKNYKLKISGNKPQLVLRIYTYLYFSFYIIKIQKVFRGLLVKKYKALHGPAAINRKICNNTEDFITMEPMQEINFHQFLSYKDSDGFIYGFDIISLHNLFLKSKDIESIRNPYNRNIIPESVVKTIKSVIRLSRILKIHINLHYEDDSLTVSNEKAVELRALALFQTIDSLGNYSNPQWFLSLNKIQMIKLVKELIEIWNYRAQLTNEIKRSICPPNGDPFRNLSIQYIHTEGNISNVRKVILEIFEKMVNNGTDKDNKSLGAYYILGCLTLVNNDAAAALPWLYQSFCYL